MRGGLRFPEMLTGALRKTDFWGRDDGEEFGIALPNTKLPEAVACRECV